MSRKGSVTSVQGSCTICHSAIGTSDYALSCGICDERAHSRCLQISNDLFRKLDKMDTGGCFNYFCSPCKAAVKKVRAGGNEQSDLNEDLIARIVTKVVEALTPKMMDLAREAALDAAEGERKKLNLVVLNLKEEYDAKEFVASACSKMSIDTDSVADSFRNGQQTQGGRSRIIKVKFLNSGARRSFLTGLRGVRDDLDGGSDVWVRPDLTYQQRCRDRELRDKLKARREAGDQVKIHRGKIVPKEQEVPKEQVVPTP